jgi:hypothetical protein
MSKTFSLTEKQRQTLFYTIANWDLYNRDYAYSDGYHGSAYNPEDVDERAERIANFETQCYELSGILNKAGFVDSVFHYHVGQEHVVCEVCEKKKEGK